MATATHTPQSVRPDRTKLYGLTHDLDGTPLRRKVRSVKCGIGVPKGPDIHAWIEPNGDWCIGYASRENGKRKPERKLFKSRHEAEQAYAEMRTKAPDREYPAKLPYFTFLRPTGEGNFIHDFEAIELHGPVPTEIDIFFTNEDVFARAYEWWAGGKLKCWGDGRNALRRKDLAKGADELEAVKTSTEKDYFPIIGGCYTSGCQYAHGDKRICKPHGKLSFQLMQLPSIGSNCTFDTTSFKSTAQLASSLMDILEITGRGDAEKGHVAGIPLKLTLGAYMAYPNGKATKLYAANVEFRPQGGADAAQVANAMIQHTYAYHAPDPLMIEAPVADVDDEAVTAAELESEFYVDQDRPDEGSEEAREQVRLAKLAELKQRGAKVTEIRTEPDNPSRQQQASGEGGDKREEVPGEPVASTGSGKPTTAAPTTPAAAPEPTLEEEPHYEASDEDVPAKIGGDPKALPKYLESIEQFRPKLGEETFAGVLLAAGYKAITDVPMGGVTIMLQKMIEAEKSKPRSGAAKDQVPGERRQSRLKGL